MKLTAAEIKSIADEIEGGMVFHLNPKTGKVIMALDFSNSDIDLECWEETIQDLEENKGQLITLNPPRSSESFRVMENFTKVVRNGKVKEQLLEALGRRGPFRNFRDVLDENDAILEQWYKFKSGWYKKYVMAFLDENEIQYEPLDIATMKAMQPVIDFHNKTFTLLQNSENGTVNDDTTFHYEQNEDIVTADYYGGSIRHGNIVARLEGEQLHMRYQCLTTDNELKSGKAIANISFDKDGCMLLSLDWQWLTQGGETGTSVYVEG